MNNENNRYSYQIGYSFGFPVIDESTGTPLLGASFELMKNGNVVSMSTSNSQGKVNFYNLSGGNFTLIESIPPNGYLPNPDVNFVNIATRRTITINGGPLSKFVVKNTPFESVHTIMYHDNTEGNTKRFEVKHNTNHVVIANPFESVHEHIEWNTESNGNGKTYKPGDSIKVTKNMTLYARWKTVKPVIIDIHVGDDTIDGTGVVGAEIIVTMPSGKKETTKVTSDKMWTVPVTEPLQKDQVVSAVQTVSNMLSSDPVTKIVLEGSYFNVTYYPNGGSNEAPHTVKVKANTTHIILSNMFTSIHTFIEWNDKVNGTGKVYKPGDQINVAEDINLYAIWKTIKPNMSDIHMGDTTINGTGQVGAEISVTFPSGQKGTTKVTSDKIWTVPVTETLEIDQTISAVQTLTNMISSDPVTKIVLEGTYYNVTYYPNIGSNEEPHIIKVKANTTYTIETNMFTSVHTFIEWNEKADGTGKVYKPGDQITVTADINLCARWKTVIPVIIDIHVGDDTIDGTGAIGAEIIVTFPSGKKETAKVTNDKMWTVPVTEPLQKDQIVSAIQTLTYMKPSDPVSKIVLEGNYFNVTYYPNGGSNEVPHVVKVKANTTYTIAPNMFTTVHTFIEWNEKADGTGKVYKPGDQIIVSGDINLYARWKTAKPVMNDVHVGDTKITGTGAVGASINVTLPSGKQESVKVGDNNGWSINVTEVLRKGQTIKATQSIINMLPSDQVEKVVQDELFNQVIYYPNGGSTEAPRIVKIKRNTTYIIENNMFKSIHTFIEWNEKADGTGKVYKSGDQITITEDVNLYARWQTNKPYINLVYVRDKVITGTGVIGAEIMVTLPSGKKETTKVLENKTWSIPVGEVLETGKIVSAIQTLTNMVSSIIVTRTVSATEIYQVIYDPNSGSTEKSHDVPVERNTTYTIENNMFTSVHSFIEWNNEYDGSGKVYHPGDQIYITSRVKLYARWKSVKPEVNNIYVNTATIIGKGIAYSKIVATLSDGRVEEADVLTGGIWYLSIYPKPKKDDTISFTQKVLGMEISDPVVKTVMDDVLYDVTYYPNNWSTEEPYVEKANIENAYRIADNMFKSVHVFMEWNTSPDGTGTRYVPANHLMVTQNMNLYARWKTVKPIVNDVYIGDTTVNGTGEIGAEVSVTFPSGKKQTNKVLENKTWSIPITESLQKDQTITANQKVTNMYISDPVIKTVLVRLLYNVTYKTNGGTQDEPYIVPVKANETYTILNNMFKSIHTFIEWNTNSNGTGKVYKPDDQITVTTDVTLYARWKSVVPVVNDTHEGETNVIGTGVAGAQIKTILPSGKQQTTTVLDNNTWLISGSEVFEKGQKIVTTQTVPNMLESDLVEKIVLDQIYYDITYHPNVGSKEQPHIVKVKANYIYTIEKNMFTSTNSFVEWNNEVDGTGKIYIPDEQIVVVENKILYAMWKSMSPTVKPSFTGNTDLTGTGISKSVILCSRTNELASSTVDENAQWIVNFRTSLETGEKIETTQTEVNMLPSDPVIYIVTPH